MEDVVITLWLNVWKWFVEISTAQQQQQQQHKKDPIYVFSSMTMGANRVKIVQLTVAKHENSTIYLIEM